MPTPQLIVIVEEIGDDQYLVKTLLPSGKEVCTHTFTYRPDTLLDLEPQWMLERAIPRASIDPALRQEGDSSPAQTEVSKLAAYGHRLYGFLFDDGRRLDNFLEFNDAYRDRVRLVLKLHGNAARLWRLPWEYLHNSDHFLALDGRFWLSRVPYGLAELTPKPVALPLRLLVVIAAPDDQASLDTEEETGVIQQALDEAVRANRVQVEYLDDATLPAIGEALRRFQPHVLHYTGHGVYDKTEAASFLALEHEDGRTHLAGVSDLRPYLAEAPDLRLVVLSGCQTAQTSPDDAFSGVATGLLQRDLPAVLAMQFSVLDDSAIELARAFYAALAHGDSLAQAMQQVRLALRDFEAGPGYDWGIPALYLRAQGLRLVAPAASPPDQPSAPPRLLDMAGLPLPPHFVGRKKELRALRHAWQDPRVNAAFVRGIGGLGKSSIAAKFLQRPGQPIENALVIRCHQVDPLDIPAKLAHWLAAQGRAGHAQAAGLLLDSRMDPAARARQAAALIADRRYVLVFDNFESLMEAAPSPLSFGKTPSPESGEGDSPRPLGEGLGVRVQDPNLAALLTGLLQSQWRSLCLFTGRLPWETLAEHLGRGTAIELHLPQLTRREAIMLMDNLPRLRPQPIATKLAVYRKVGGHPKSLELLNGWLARGLITDLLNDPHLDDLLAQEWEDYFLRALLAHLPPAEQQQLTRLSIFRASLADEEFGAANVSPAARQRWLDLSLLQQEQTATAPPHSQLTIDHSPFTIHPVVREYLLHRLPAEDQRELHLWAAGVVGRPFVEIARDFAAQSGESWTEAEIESLARGARGVVGQMVARTDDLPAARSAMARALAWQHHLFAAGQFDPADDIVNAVVDILARWGERDRAKALLRGSIETQEGGNKAVAQGNLAILLQEEGKLAEALATHGEIYHTFEQLDAKQNMAEVLNRQSQILDTMGRLDEAITKQEASLAIRREIGEEEGQAISLHQLSILYYIKEDYPTALARSREAEVLNHELNREVGIASNLHQQGIIFDQMARVIASDSEAIPTDTGAETASPAARRDMETEAQANEYRQTAIERFQASLDIKRRIGNEAGAADSLGELGKLLRDAGQMEAAIAAFNEARDIFQRTNNPAKLAITLEDLGIIHENQGHYAAALEKYEQALALFKQYASPDYVADTERNIARMRGKLGG